MDTNTVNIVRDSTKGNKIVEVYTANGKPAKKSFMRGLRKAQETSYWKEFRDNKICRNPFTGVEIELSPFEASIYEWCTNWYRRYSIGQMDAPVQAYDDMKYFLLELNPDAYYDLLD